MKNKERGICSFLGINVYSSEHIVSMLPKVAAIVVSHNSETTLERCLKCLGGQLFCLETIVVVDAGSSDRTYLQFIDHKRSIQLLLTDNIGFSRANNLGYESLASSIDFVLFVNPDLFLPSDFVSKALRVFESNSSIGMLSGKLLGYDLVGNKPSGRIDSTGVFRKWYGRWHDRGQGEPDINQYDIPEEMAALCGALLCCRNSALRSLAGPVFDGDFFLYKEDIELSIRLQKMGWKLLYHPMLEAYHCRGWTDERKKMSYELRVLAAKSELLLYKKHPSPYVLWAFFKYLLVTVFRF